MKKTKLDYQQELNGIIKKPGEAKRVKYIQNKINKFTEDEMRQELHYIDELGDNGMSTPEHWKRREQLIKRLYF